MKRAHFLRGLLALPFLPGALTAQTKKGPLGGVKGTTLPEVNPDPLCRVPTCSLNDPSLMRLITRESGGLVPGMVFFKWLVPTGDARKFSLTVVFNQRTYQKSFIVSGLALRLSKNQKAEVAYATGKAATEIARDMAYDRWGSNWREEVEKWRISRFDVLGNPGTR